MISKVHILVIVEKKSQRAVFKLLAECLDIVTRMASSITEALDAIEDNLFDAIVIDLQPQTKRIVCAKTIHESVRISGRNVPIVALSELSHSVDDSLSVSAGIDDFLLKPFTVKQFQEALNKWTDREIVENFDVAFSLPPTLEELTRFRKHLHDELAVATE